MSGGLTKAMSASGVCVVAGEEISRYGFGDDHPFGPDRHDVFIKELSVEGLDEHVAFASPRVASDEELAYFHTREYLARVAQASELGTGFLDAGDTPAFPGVYGIAATVVGATLTAVHRVMNQQCRRAFAPIAGLHHAGRNHAAGFCVFNDCGVAVECLRRSFDVKRVAYVDIDAHHGDGVFYSFEDDPDLLFADTHEDGRYLYPGTGSAKETGIGEAEGTKLNIPLAPGAEDSEFLLAWKRIEEYLEDGQPEFILFQCGADSLEGDPITHLRLTEEAHAHAAERLCMLADKHCQGRIVAMGGGGYNRRNLARAWSRVVRAFVEAA